MEVRAEGAEGGIWGNRSGDRLIKDHWRQVERYIDLLDSSLPPNA